MEPHFFNPFPEIHTNRLVLRSLELSDAEAIFQHRSNPLVTTYLEDFPHASIEETRAFIERVQREIREGRTILWVLSRPGQPAFMGTVCLWNIDWQTQKAETGYTMEPDFYGQGFMSEALAAALAFGFDTMGIRYVDAYTHENNEPSIRLLERHGFQSGTPQKPVSANRHYFFRSSAEPRP